MKNNYGGNGQDHNREMEMRMAMFGRANSDGPVASVNHMNANAAGRTKPRAA